MGQYIQSTDLESRLGSARFTALCGIASNERTALIDGIIARAEAVIEGFASVRYATPLRPTPFVMEWALRLAEYELYKRGPGGTVPEKIRESYRDAIGQLSDLAAGRLETGAQLGEKLHKLGGASIRIHSAASVFDPASMD